MVPFDMRGIASVYTPSAYTPCPGSFHATLKWSELSFLPSASCQTPPLPGSLDVPQLVTPTHGLMLHLFGWYWVALPDLPEEELTSVQQQNVAPGRTPEDHKHRDPKENSARAFHLYQANNTRISDLRSTNPPSFTPEALKSVGTPTNMILWPLYQLILLHKEVWESLFLSRYLKLCSQFISGGQSGRGRGGADLTSVLAAFWFKGIKTRFCWKKSFCGKKRRW